MPSQRTRRILIRTLLVLFISIGIFVFIFKQRISNVYDNTIEPTSFQDVVLEKDTAKNSTLPVKNLPIDSSSINTPTSHPSFSTKAPSSNNQWQNKPAPTAKQKTTNEAVNTSVAATARKGKEIKAKDLPLLDKYNSRVRLTTFMSKFGQGDYISGMEFSNLYRRDPSIGKLTKSTICSFIEKNVSQITRNGNSFIISTVNPNGIHTKVKIPFVEDLQINIDDGAQLIIGETFTSKAPAFSKSILLPIQLQLINIVHNGEQFPTSGYISGDFYFIDYSKTKMAYKIR